MYFNKEGQPSHRHHQQKIKNINKEKYVNKEKIVILQITMHLNKFDKPLAIPVTIFLVTTAVDNVLDNVKFQLAEQVIWRKDIQPDVH